MSSKNSDPNSASKSERFAQHIRIAGRLIGPDEPAYIIAEMSANHGQSLAQAKEIVHAAKEAGADAIKLQTYRADTLTMKSDQPHFFIKDGPWQGQYLYDLYEHAHMPWEFHAELFELAKTLDLTCFSSPFDASAVTLLEQFDCPAYKIASPELIDRELIECVAQTGKPVIMSTGGATLDDIDEAVSWVRQAGVQELCVLKCTSEYPAPVEAINLATLNDLRERYACPIGFSDHTLGIHIPLAAVAMGAQVIEKHFMLESAEATADSFFSVTPAELETMVRQIRDIERARGVVHYPEQGSQARRCLYLSQDLKAGDCLTRDNLVNLRPGGGELMPKELPQLLGRRVRSDLPRGTQLKREHLD